MKCFTQALPNSNVAPTPSPYSYTPGSVTHARIFFRLSTPILTILSKDLPPISSLTSIPPYAKMLVYGLPHTTSHYQPQTPPLCQHNILIPLLALPTLRFFPTSLPQLTTFLQKVLLRQYQPPSSTLRQHRIQIPLQALPTPRFFPSSLPQFQQR